MKGLGKRAMIGEGRHKYGGGLWGWAAEELYKDLRRKVTPEELAAETDLTVGEIEEAYRLSGEQIDTIEINLSDRR